MTEELGMDLILDENDLGGIGEEATQEEHNEPNNQRNNDNTDINAEEVHDVIPEDVGVTESPGTLTQSDGYSSLAEVLREQGVLPHYDDSKKKIESIDDLVEVFKNEITSNEYAGLNDYQKEYLDSLRNGIPQEIIQERQKERYILDSLTDEQIENEANETIRKDLITDYFVSKGFQEDEAISLAEQQINIGNDIVYAKKALNTIKDIKAKEYQSKIDAQMAQRKKEQDIMDKYKKTVYEDNVSEDLKITKEFRDKIYDASTKIVGKTESGIPLTKISKYQMENPIEYQFKLSYLFELTDGFKDFSRLASKKKAISEASKKLDKFIRSNSISSINGNQSIPYTDTESSFSLDDVVIDI